MSETKIVRKKYSFKNFKVNTINELDIFLNNLKKEAKLENNFKTLGIDIKNNYKKKCYSTQ